MPFPFYYASNATKFVLLSVLTLLETICLKISAKLLPKDAKALLAVDVLCFIFQVRPIETTRRAWLSENLSEPKQIQQQTDKLLFVSNAPRKPFTTILNYGATKWTSTFQEGRLGWTLTRPSYQLIGTHRLIRSVLE